MLNNQYNEDVMALRSYAQKLNWFQNLFFPKKLKTELLQYSPTNTPAPSAAFQVYAIYSKSFGLFNWFHLLGLQFLSGLNEFSQKKTTKKINALTRLTENSFTKLIDSLNNCNEEESIAESQCVADTSDYPSPTIFDTSPSSDEISSYDASASHNTSKNELLNDQTTCTATISPPPANEHSISGKIESIPSTPPPLLPPIQPSSPKDNSYNKALSELLHNTEGSQQTPPRTPITKPEKEIKVSTDSISITTPIKRIIHRKNLEEPICNHNPIPQIARQKTHHQSCCTFQ